MKRDKLKVVKKLKLKELYEIDGGFFYIEKIRIKHPSSETFYRYYLKTSVTPKKMKLLINALEGRTPCINKANLGGKDEH